MHHNYFNFLSAQSVFKWRIFDSFSAVSAFEQSKFMKIHRGLSPPQIYSSISERRIREVYYKISFILFKHPSGLPLFHAVMLTKYMEVVLGIFESLSI